MIENERKFKLSHSLWRDLLTKYNAKFPYLIDQFYLSIDYGFETRLRMKYQYPYPTEISIVCKFGGSHQIRKEHTIQLKMDEGEQLFKECEIAKLPRVTKERNIIHIDGFKCEVDQFLYKHDGLYIIEVEQPEGLAPDILRTHPDSEEVTGMQRYYNAWIAKNGIEGL